MKRLLVIEDGNEYEEFARLFLAADYDVRAAHSLREAVALLAAAPADAFLVDLRFTWSDAADLVGDVAATAASIFADDREKAARYLREQQGAIVLGELRKLGHAQRAVFVHDFPPRRLANLRSLYGDVHAAASFDASAVRRALAGEP